MAEGESRQVVHTHTHRVEGEPYMNLVTQAAGFLKEGAKLLSSLGDFFASRAQDIDMQLQIENDHEVVNLKKDLLKAKLRAEVRGQDQRNQGHQNNRQPRQQNNRQAQNQQPRQQPQQAAVGPVDSKTQPVKEQRRQHGAPPHKRPLPNPVLPPEVAAKMAEPGATQAPAEAAAAS